MTIRAVFLDLDGTLLRDDRMPSIVVSVAVEVARLAPGVDARRLVSMQHEVNRRQWAESGEELLTGRVVGDAYPREVWRRTLAAFGLEDEALVDRAVSAQIAAELASHTLYDESAAVLRELRDRGMALGLITNGSRVLQRSKLSAVGLDEAFDIVLVSGELGVYKPAEEIFRLGVQGLGVAASEALHVGDDLEADVAGARGAGLRAVWVDRRGASGLVPGASIADAVVSDLNGVIALLD